MNTSYNLSGSGITQIILTPTGTINWTNNNVDLNLPVSSSIVIQPGSAGLQSNFGSPPCNANRTVSFGSVTIASCNGGGGGIDYDFVQVNAAGGMSGVTPSVACTSNSPLCAGGTLNLTATGAGGVGPYTYAWTGPSGFVSALQNPTRTPVVAGTYNVTVTDVGGNTGVNSTVVVVNSSVTPSVSIASNVGTTICSGASVTFTATPTNGGASPTYNFRVNGSTVQNTTSNTFTTSAFEKGE